MIQIIKQFRQYWIFVNAKHIVITVTGISEYNAISWIPTYNILWFGYKYIVFLCKRKQENVIFIYIYLK